MPHQNRAPSHRIWLDLAAAHWQGKFDATDVPECLEPADYYRLLSPLGEVAVWETEYFQVLPASKGAHPVRVFTSATFARPLLASLDEIDVRTLCAMYDEAMEAAYPPGDDGNVLFPFRRLFFTLQR